MSATILVVDDMPYIREPIAASLRLAGYEAQCVGSGAEAFSIILHNPPALLLLDLEMPGMSGLDLLARLVHLPAERRPRTIVLTASQDRRSVLRAGELGVRHFLLKSTFSLANLLERVKAVLAEAPDAAAASEQPPTASTIPAPTPVAAAPCPAAPPRTETAAPTERPRPGANLADLAPLMTREELLRRVQRAGEPPALSPSVAGVLEMSEDPTTTAEAIAAAIKRDQALALKILKLANSSAYSLGKKTTSVDQAVVRIGMDAIRQALLNIGVIDALGTDAADCPLDPLRFWEHSIACGLIAAEIEQATGGTATDTAFTLGLLHDVGRLVLAQALGATYREVLDTAERLRLPLEAVESRLLGFNHAEIMPDILRRWNVPKCLAEPIVAHHDEPGAAPPDRLAALLCLADRLARALLLGSSGNDTLYPIADLVRTIGLQEQDLRRIIAAAAEHTRDVKVALLACSSHTGWPDHRESYRGQLTAPLRPLCVGTPGTIESFQIACETLAEGPGKPTVGVVTIGPDDNRPALAERYRAALAAAGMKNLPLVTISPDGAGLGDARTISETRLTSPVAFSTLIEALNSAIAPAAKQAA